MIRQEIFKFLSNRCQVNLRKQKRARNSGGKVIDPCFNNVLYKELQEEPKKKKTEKVKVIASTSSKVNDGEQDLNGQTVRSKSKGKYLSQNAREVADELEQIDREFELDANPDLIRVNINATEEKEFPANSEDEDGLIDESSSSEGDQSSDEDSEPDTVSCADTVQTDTVVMLKRKMNSSTGSGKFDHLRDDPEFLEYVQSCVHTVVQKEFSEGQDKRRAVQNKDRMPKKVDEKKKKTAEKRSKMLSNSVKSPSDMTLYAPVLNQLPTTSPLKEVIAPAKGHAIQPSGHLTINDSLDNRISNFIQGIRIQGESANK